MTCKQVLYKYIQENEGWHKKVSLYSVAEDWSPETVGRTLRDLEELGKIEVGKYNGRYRKGLVRYRIPQKDPVAYRNVIDPSTGEIIKQIPVYG